MSTRKHRSRRLRKKLFLDEFEVLGFELSIVLKLDISSEECDNFWRHFIRDAIEAHYLTYGGLDRGYVCPEHGVSATEQHREILRFWLSARPEVAQFEIGELINANSWPPSLYPLLLSQ